MRQKAYRAYLQSAHWKELRERVLDRDGRKCVECESTGHLNVHHSRYTGDLTKAEMSDLRTLCRTCHRIEHDMFVYFPIDLAIRYYQKFLNYCLKVSGEQWADLAQWVTTDEDREDAVRLITFYRRSELKESCDDARAWAERIVDGALKNDLSLGDACEVAWKRYPIKKDQNYDKHMDSAVESGSGLDAVGRTA